ncbi:MAG: hypothetical protein H6738_03390 [Alphaproteobacteria bacterium]|nr:hypothetical protein [Alphaproteobacteria bacterium]MCB9695811.1 hypothetical protein [Alphaproteobacteria bacterium]
MDNLRHRASAALLMAMLACRHTTTQPTDTQVPTASADTATLTTSACAVTSWPDPDDRSSLRACDEDEDPRCFPGELCADVCRVDCSHADCPDGETCSTDRWTTTGTSTYDYVFGSTSACLGAGSTPLADGPRNGLSAFVPTTLPTSATLVVAGEQAVWASTTDAVPRLLSVALGPDHLPNGAFTDLGPGPLAAEPDAGVEAHGRLVLLYAERVFSAPVTGATLGVWREESPLPAAVQRPALLDGGDWLVVAAGTISGAPSPLVQSAEVGADGVIAPWTRAFVSAIAGPGRHAAVVADELVLLTKDGEITYHADLDTLPEPAFVASRPPPHVRSSQQIAVAAGSLCDALVMIGQDPSLSTQLLPWETLQDPDTSWRLGSIVSDEWRPPRDTTTHGSWLHVLAYDGTTLWSAGRTP